jgi:adenine-specific DNA-methyltransferase
LNEEPKDGESVIWPIHPDATEKVWRYSLENIIEEPDRFKAELVNDRIELYRKKYLNTQGLLPRTWWDKAAYSARDRGTRQLVNLFGESYVFDFPKAVGAVMDSLRVLKCNSNEFVLDIFSGSGTTGHAVLNLNKDDNGNRKYMLVEMGPYFNTVLKPRLLKVTFSDKWKDGVPQNKDGQSHAFKYHFIESYEDALNNIAFKNKDEAQGALEFDDYMLHYMLDFETEGASPALLKEEAFEMPFDYQLKIQRGHESPAKENVDLVETFHYLIGLWVKTLRMVEHQDRNYIVSTGEIRSEDAIEDVLVIWRSTEGLDLDKEAEWLQKDIIKDQTFDRMYINGNSKIKDAEPTEITFREKMFE